MTTSPLGLRTNNPGNLRASNGLWQGQIGITAQGFCVFDTPENGLRALCKNLVLYHTSHALSTVRGIITRWAPPSENDTLAYVIAVANRIGYAPDAQLRMNDPAIIAALCGAIVNHENGQQPFSAKMLQQAARSALGLAVAAQEKPPAAAMPGTAPPPQQPPQRTERLDGVPVADLAQRVNEFKAAGALVVATAQPNGTYTILATFDRED